MGTSISSNEGYLCSASSKPSISAKSSSRLKPANDSRDDPEVRVEGTPSVVDLISGDNCESIEGVAAGGLVFRLRFCRGGLFSIC